MAGSRGAHLCDGDVLGLAAGATASWTGWRIAGRDSIDEPSFLRFHGTASADLFQTAREWLVRVREPARAWILRHGESGRLRSPGLDAETEATVSYAQMMLAWGWAAWASAGLARLGRPRESCWPAVPAWQSNRPDTRSWATSSSSA